MKIPIVDTARQYASLKKELDAAILSVAASGKYVLGECGKGFEEKLSGYVGARYGIGVNSGTDALKIALRAVGVGPNDEVITVTNTAVPTVSAIRELGAIPVFVDIDRYFTMDAAKIEKAITKKTRAILPVHLYGQPCDMEAIMKIAKKHGLKVIEDCAQSTGAEFQGKKTGSFGGAACFSFYPTKNLGAIGDGGMIITSDATIADRCRRLRMYGMEKTYYAKGEGFNSRLDEIQAAALSIKMQRLDQWNTRRLEIANYYIQNIRNPLIAVPQIRTGSKHVFHLFVVRTPKRDELKKHLEENQIGFGTHYEFPIHLQEAYKFLGYKKGGLPGSEKAADEVLSLPIFPELTDAEAARVVEVLNAFK